MNVLKKIIFFLLIVFVGIQFIPTNRNQSDEILESDFSKTFNVPSNIQNLFKKSCYDCHSNNTSYPWYNKIQPASWFLEKHIKEGKETIRSILVIWQLIQATHSGNSFRQLNLPR